MLPEASTWSPAGVTSGRLHGRHSARALHVAGNARQIALVAGVPPSRSELDPVFTLDHERVLVLGLRDGNGFIARFWM